MWSGPSRTPLKSICYDNMETAWNKASGNGRLSTHWRQVFYVMRPICDDHPDSDRPLRDTTFKNILESYLKDYSPGWDVLKGARGVFKEPHRPDDDSGLAMSTMNVRNYLRGGSPSSDIKTISSRFPTKGYANRFGAILVCEKEGFDDLLEDEQIPERYDLALMSTKGISAEAARHLAESVPVPVFTLHDFDKNGFVMAGGFTGATDIGIRLEDIAEWDLTPEDQVHQNWEKTRRNLIRNGATPEEADYIANGQRVELNMFTSPQLIEYIEGKLEEHGVEKVIPDDDVLIAAWKRAKIRAKVNDLILKANKDGAEDDVPNDLADQIRERLEDDPEMPWDDVLADLVEELA